jgi:hypothetical protein
MVEKREEKRGLAEGQGLVDASVIPGTPGILMVDETRQSMGSLANRRILDDGVPSHNRQSDVLLRPNIRYYFSTVHGDA